MTTFLPATMPERIRDLMDQNHISQSELAAKLNMTDSALSRFLNGKTSKISDDAILKLAEIFCVSTDFLYGTTDIPDRMNYDIAELGLSSLAAKNLYTEQVDPQVVCRLLEHPKFALLSNMVDWYFSDITANVVAVQNQMYNTMTNAFLELGKPEVARRFQAFQVMPYQADLYNIQATFLEIIQDIKTQIGYNIMPIQDYTKEAMHEFHRDLTKGQHGTATVTAEHIAKIWVHVLKKHGVTDPELLQKFKCLFVEISNAIKESQFQSPA